MSVEVKVVKFIDKNNVQVDVKGARAGAHSYKVPTENSDEFCANYKKFNKRRNFFSDLAFVSSVFTGSFIGKMLTDNDNATKNRTVTAMIAGGIGLGIIADLITKVISNKKQAKIITKFNAQEIEYKKSQTVSDLIK